MAVEKFTVAKMLGLSSVPVLRAQEAAAETFIEGSPLVIGAGGAENELTEAATDVVNDIVGIANKAASGTQGDDIEFIPALPGVMFEGNVGATVSTGSIVADDLMNVFPLTLTGTDWFIDTSDNTTPAVRIVGFKDPVGTLNGRVYFIFLTDTTAWAN